MIETIPHDVASEEAVIASLLIDGDVLSQLDLVPDDFFTPKCREIYQSMLNLNQIDSVTVSHELARLGKLEEIGGAAYLSFVISQIPTSLHARYYAEIVKKCSLNRKLIQAGYQIAKLAAGNDNPQKNLAEAKELLTRVNEHLPQTEALTANELAKQAADHYGNLRHNCPGLRLGIERIDEKLGGLLPGESMLIGAPTFTGKTVLAAQIAGYVSQAHWVLFASEEMTDQDIINKLVGQISGVSSKLISLGNYPDERLDRMIQALAKVAELKLRITKCQTTSRLRAQVEKYKPDLIIVDFLQRLKDRYGDGETSRIGYIAKALPDIAKEFKTPMIVLSQFHRVEGENPRPRLNSFRQSGEIEENFDLICGLWRESYSAFLELADTTANQTDLLILKDKYRGDPGQIHLIWNKEHEKYD